MIDSARRLRLNEHRDAEEGAETKKEKQKIYCLPHLGPDIEIKIQDSSLHSHDARLVVCIAWPRADDGLTASHSVQRSRRAGEAVHHQVLHVLMKETADPSYILRRVEGLGEALQVGRYAIMYIA